MLDTFDSLDRRDGRKYDKCIVQIFILLPHVSISWDQYHEIAKKEKHFTVHFGTTQMIRRCYKFSLQMPNQIYNIM